MKTIAILFLAILTMFFTCEKTEVIEVDYLFYGTSFGECIGYCTREVIVSGQAVFIKSGWDLDGSLPDSSCSIQYFVNPLPAYLEKIDIAYFKSIDDVIGCPDCADGGAEWLELSFEGDVKRVTFEYMNEPSELTEVITDLRGLMESFGDCR